MTTINATIKNILIAQNDKPIVVHTAYLRLTPDYTVAAALSQVLYWHGVMKGKKFYKTNDDFAAELRLTPKQFERVKIVLKALPFLTITREQIPARTVYDVNYEKLAEALKGENIPSPPAPDSTTPVESSFPQKGVTSSAPLVASSSPLLGDSNTENTPEITQNNNTATQPLPEIQPVLEPVVVEKLEKTFSKAELPAAKKQLAAIPSSFHLQVLAVFMTNLKTTVLRKSKISYFCGIIKKVQEGTFTPLSASAQPISTEEMIRRDKLKQKEAEERGKVNNVDFYVNLYKTMKGQVEIPEKYKTAVFERLACCG